MIDLFRRPSALLSALVLAAPTVTCLLLRLAAPAPGAPEALQVGTVTANSAQEPPAAAIRDMSAPANLDELLARAAELRTAAQISNPFHFPRELAPVAAAVEIPERRPEPELPDLRLSGFFSGATPMAIIEGRARQPGDTVAPGWVLTSISLRDQRVVLTGPGGHTLHLTVTR